MNEYTVLYIVIGILLLGRAATDYKKVANITKNKKVKSTLLRYIIISGLLIVAIVMDYILM